MKQSGFIPIKVEALPTVQTFEANADPRDIVDALKLAGGCRIKNDVTKDILAQTRRVQGMIGKPPICASTIINHPLYQPVCTESLTTRNWY
jgi:hypothetical protein